MDITPSSIDQVLLCLVISYCKHNVLCNLLNFFNCILLWFGSFYLLQILYSFFKEILKKQICKIISIIRNQAATHFTQHANRTTVIRQALLLDSLLSLLNPFKNRLNFSVQKLDFIRYLIQLGIRVIFNFVKNHFSHCVFVIGPWSTIRRSLKLLGLINYFCLPNVRYVFPRWMFENFGLGWFWNRRLYSTIPWIFFWLWLLWRHFVKFFIQHFSSFFSFKFASLHLAINFADFGQCLLLFLKFIHLLLKLLVHFFPS